MTKTSILYLESFLRDPELLMRLIKQHAEPKDIGSLPRLSLDKNCLGEHLAYPGSGKQVYDPILILTWET